MSDITARIQLRRDTAANWTTNNPTLRAGELGFETDTRRAKLGDGTTAWNSLAYLTTLGETNTTRRSGITSPFSTSSASLVDITGLNVSLDANSIYRVYAYIVCQSTNVNTGFGQTFSFTGSPTKIHLLGQQQRSTTVSLTTSLNNITASDDVNTQNTVAAANTDYFVLTRGIVVTGASPSTMQARLVRGGSANNVSAQYGYIICDKVS